MKKYQDQLESAYQDYEKVFVGIAEEAQQKYIIPYLKKNNLHMLVGNGTYYIFDPNISNKYVYFDIPKRINSILTIPVNTQHDMELGCWMIDYIGA